MWGKYNVMKIHKTGNWTAVSTLNTNHDGLQSITIQNHLCLCLLRLT
uniref:Uncharacterized protein n=1 Tax=Anguilla anguilla TaxID=7936 RepID=A0A0E9WI44_ANGAN